MSDKELLKEVLDHFGFHYQLRQTQEECGELIVAINHVFRHRANVNSLLEEIADVEIMINQLKLFFDPEVYDVIKRQKLTRIRDFVKKDNNNRGDAA